MNGEPGSAGVARNRGIQVIARGGLAVLASRVHAANESATAEEFREELLRLAHRKLEEAIAHSGPARARFALEAIDLLDRAEWR